MWRLGLGFSTSTFTTALAFSEVSLTACCGPWACPQLRLGTSASKPARKYRGLEQHEPVGVWKGSGIDYFYQSPRKPLLDSYQIFPRVEKCASCSSNNKDLLVSWVFESPSTASEPFDNCTSYLCIKSLILMFVIQLELITLNVEKISHRRL